MMKIGNRSMCFSILDRYSAAHISVKYFGKNVILTVIVYLDIYERTIRLSLKCHI